MSTEAFRTGHLTQPNRPRRAFTLLELLVVIAIISVLRGLILAGVQKVRASAASVKCANQMRQLAMACHTFHDRNQKMPPAFGFLGKASLYNGAALGPLFFHLLPDIDQQNLFQQSRHQPPSTPQQDFYFYTAHGVHQTPVAMY